MVGRQGVRVSDELDIGAIEARLNAATPGPWTSEMDADKKATARDWREVWAGSNAVVVADGYERHSAGETETVYGVRIRAANAELIAHAPEDLRALLAEVRRLRSERDPDGVLDESIAACDILGIDRTGDYDYLATLRAVVRDRDEARAALQSARVDGARAMREVASDAAGDVYDALNSEGDSEEAMGASRAAERIRALDPAAVVGSAPEPIGAVVGVIDAG